MSEIPGAHRIEQFDIKLGTYASVRCKACGQSPNWAINTGQSPLLELLEAIALHQCETEQRLRHQMTALARQMRQEGNHELARTIDDRIEEIYPPHWVGDDD